MNFPALSSYRILILNKKFGGTENGRFDYSFRTNLLPSFQICCQDPILSTLTFHQHFEICSTIDGSILIKLTSVANSGFEHRFEIKISNNKKVHLDFSFDQDCIWRQFLVIVGDRSCLRSVVDWQMDGFVAR